MRLCVSINPIKAIVGESVLACLIATLCALLIHVPVWAMFIGWITFFTRGPSAREGVVNWGCVLGAWTVIPVGLGVTLLVLALKWVPVFNNVLGYFLGTVCYFASHLPPSLSTLLDLAVALSLGVIGGFLASVVNRYWSETGMRSARG